MCRALLAVMGAIFRKVDLLYNKVYKSNKSICAIRRFSLGHESLKTTRIYLSSIDTEGVVKANRRMIGRILRR